MKKASLSVITGYSTLAFLALGGWVSLVWSFEPSEPPNQLPFEAIRGGSTLTSEPGGLSIVETLTGFTCFHLLIYFLFLLIKFVDFDKAIS